VERLVWWGGYRIVILADVSRHEVAIAKNLGGTIRNKEYLKKEYELDPSLCSRVTLFHYIAIVRANAIKNRVILERM
jgi:hypothetical protein